MVFYNTIYWRRASDGFKPPKLTRDERLQSQPTRDLAVIKPRARPRARLDSAETASPEVSVPLIHGANSRAGELERAQAAQPAQFSSERIIPSSGELLKTRRKRRRNQLPHSKGFLARWFG